MIDFVVQPQWQDINDNISINSFVVYLDIGLDYDVIEDIKNITKIDDSTYEYNVLSLA